MFAVGLGNDVKMPFLQQVASNPEFTKHLENADDLLKFLPAIGTIVSGGGGGAEAVTQAIIDI